MNIIVTNEDVALALDELADRLEEREANEHRVRAYRNASTSVRSLEVSVTEMLEQGGVAALQKLPGVGPRIASRIAGFIHTGHLQLLDELDAAFTPEDVFTRVPTIGAELARQIHSSLGIRTLEELEVAAHDGRLDALPGFGIRRVRLVQAYLGMMLSRRERRDRIGAARETASGPGPWKGLHPDIATLLDVDAEYRERSANGDLPRIAPRRFNPEGIPWLPVLRTQRNGWNFSVLYSNTPAAHQLGKEKEWVVIYYERKGRRGQCTVVTESRGDLRGRRVVRGRETESHNHQRGTDVRAA